MEFSEKEHQLRNALNKRERRITDTIAKFAGDIRFVYVHTFFFLIWIAGNVIFEWSFDPYPFIFLTFVVSLEAIFLSTFVLINQNKDAERSERRAKLDLAVDRRAEKNIADVKKSIEEIKAILEKRV